MAAHSNHSALLVCWRIVKGNDSTSGNFNGADSFSSVNVFSHSFDTFKFTTESKIRTCDVSLMRVEKKETTELEDN